MHNDTAVLPSLLLLLFFFFNCSHHEWGPSVVWLSRTSFFFLSDSLDQLLAETAFLLSLFLVSILDLLL